MPPPTRFPRDVPRLTDGGVTLRAHHTDDIPLIVEQNRDPLSLRFTSVPVQSGVDDAARFIQGVASDWEGDAAWWFAIEAVDPAAPHLGPRFGGTVLLRNQGFGRAEIAYSAHPWLRGTGLMERAARLLLAWGFDACRLRTVTWWAHRGNWSSRKLAWRLGFSCFGPLPDSLEIRGELRDGWVGAVTSTDDLQPRHPWYDAPRIVGRSVELRSHLTSDIPAIVEACRDERTRAWLGTLPDPYTEQDAREFVESRTDAMATGKAVHWAIGEPGTQRLLGVINVFDIEPGVDGEIGYWTHPAARGRGVMTEACRLVVRHAFLPLEVGGLGMGRLKMCAAVGNAASRHVIESCGFKEYGVERRGVRIGGGVLADLACYDLLLEEAFGDVG